jgi:hypothetical protein
MNDKFSKLQLKALSEFMSSIYNANNTLNQLGVNITNHDVTLFTDKDFNLYVKFYRTIANGDGVNTTINYLQIGVLGEKINLNLKYDIFELDAMFKKLEPITL